MDHKAIIKAVLFTPGLKGSWGLPLLGEGKPGSGKTSTIEQIGADCGLEVETVIASLREPSDFLGLPVPMGDRTAYSPPAWAARVAGKRAIVHLDEINTAAPAVQAALLRTVLDRVVGDLALGGGVRFLASQNATEDAAGGWDLAAPLANRFGHMAWETPDAQRWADWMLAGAGGEDQQGGFDPEKEEARVLKAWPTPWAKAQGLVTGFIMRRPELLLKQPPSGDPKCSKAWPSPRTWEMATRALASAEVHGLSAVDSDEMLSMFVGVGAASELVQFVQNADLPDPAAVLDGKVTFKPDNRLDRTMAVLSSCAALVAPQAAEKRKARAAKLWGLMDAVSETALDLIVPAVRAVANASKGAGADKDLTRLPEAQDVILKLEPVLQAAGLMRK